MIRKRVQLVVVLWVLGLLVAVLGSTSCRRKQPEARPVEVGAVFPLSGNLGYVGKMLADGCALAVEDVNAKGGIRGVPLHVRFDDSQGKPDIGVTAAQKMIDVDKVPVVMTALSSVTLGVQPVVERANRILVGLCMHPEFFKKQPNTFRLYEGAEQEGVAIGEYVAALPSSSAPLVVGVFYADVPNIVEELDKYIRPPMKAAGVDFKVSEPYLLSDKEFRDKVLKLKAAGITHLVILGYGFEYPNIFRELKAQQLLPDVHIIGGWGFLYPMLEAKDLEGVAVAGPEYVFGESSEIRGFYDRFKQKHGYAANFDAALAYNALMITVESLRKAPSTSAEDLRAALKSTREYKGLLGTVTVDEEGALKMKIGVGQFRGGRLFR